MQERKRIDSTTREALTILYAASQVIENVGVAKLERLSKRVPNGWRDLKMISTRLGKLITAMLDTLPLSQLDTMIAAMRISHLQIVTNEVGKKDTANWLVPRSDLTALVAAVVDNKCLMCDQCDWYKCELRRIIQDLPVDVENVPNTCWRQ